MNQKHRNKYILVFLLTIGIFFGAWYGSYTLNKKKIASLQSTQDQISLDILISETQFDLLKEISCDAGGISTFAGELDSLADKIAYSENNFGSVEEITTLKKQYTLLQIRDFLLTKRVSERCKQSPAYIFYFYGTEVGCPSCVRQGYVLDALRSQRPDVRIYAFDYYLDLSTIKALREIYQIGDTLPALVINGATYNGFQSLDDINKLLPRK